jgi:hypothetical protein
VILANPVDNPSTTLDNRPRALSDIAQPFFAALSREYHR